MNERIKELIKEVGTDVSGKWMNIDNTEKLAELIVKECAKVADSEWADPGHQIKQHFGVED
jgi:hypothetical protein